MSASYLTSLEKEALPSSSASVRESLLLVRKDLSNHRGNNKAFQDNLDVCLEDITSKLDRVMRSLDNSEGSNPTNVVAGDHGSASFEALHEDLETLREASKANKIRAEASQAKLEASLRALEVTIGRAGTPGGGQMITDPSVSAPVFNIWTSVKALSTATRELAVSYAEASQLSGYSYLIHTPLTLLELAYQQRMKPNHDIIAQMCMEQELGMRPEECAQQAAFRRIIPVAFGTGEETYKLSAIPAPEYFQANTFPDPSLSYRLRSALHDASRTVKEMIRSARLPDAVKGLLTEMMELSHRFVESMLAFMWDFYGWVKETAFSEEDSWELSQRLTWGVLMDLSACHKHAPLVSCGSDCRTLEYTGDVLWATLQMHKVMATYAKHSSHWEDHPSLNPMITMFMLSKVVMRSELEEVKREVEVLRATVASLQGSNPDASHSHPTREARRRRRRGRRNNEAEDVGATHDGDDADSAQDEE